MSDMHPVVTLLLARIESHPEDFHNGNSRWGYLLETVQINCSEDEESALRNAVRKARLDGLHEEVMDELLNGPERAREAEAAQQKMMAQMQANMPGYAANTANAAAQLYSQTQLSQAYANAQNQMLLGRMRLEEAANCTPVRPSEGRLSTLRKMMGLK